MRCRIWSLAVIEWMTSLKVAGLHQKGGCKQQPKWHMRISWVCGMVVAPQIHFNVWAAQMLLPRWMWNFKSKCDWRVNFQVLIQRVSQKYHIKHSGITTIFIHTPSFSEAQDYRRNQFYIQMWPVSLVFHEKLSRWKVSSCFQILNLHLVNVNGNSQYMTQSGVAANERGHH